uniref:Tubby C-terminal domain-containing protein n=1 Tax=Neobodo designis TaxID=312471 RepID=A0A7S1M9R3_NEODS|eukprot:CAMPEP_0174850958 /NCGR_PEP_ID=MMETSP1114-20130205/21226_1 /TAXON_ID=312471 /ORGANISM="Neobodo designis, Strain CCAP 1951/1" /LENGTH=393 /DNA_ID=CAMNT_0016085453 /DNA_START=50 /DNA_END=1231 /DNA_ORIENTATION=+
MSDTLQKRQASAGRGRGRGGGGASAMTINLNRPAAFSANAMQQPQQGGNTGTNTATASPAPSQMPSQANLLGQPYLNSSSMLGRTQSSMVAARPSQEQQQQQNARRVQQQLEAFGIAALVAPDGGTAEDEAQLRAHGFAEEQMVEGKLADVVPRRGLLKCSVVRTRTGVISTTQRFHMFVEGGDKFVLAGRKRANKQTSNFLMSRDRDDLERESDHFHGKVRANFAGTDFVIYDHGDAPEKTGGDPARTRIELGAVLYETNIAGTKGPRKMTVILPKPGKDGKPEVFQPKGENDGIVAAYRADPSSDRFYVLVNKEPKWNEQLRSYQLNFNGRVSKASVKNFQLVERGNQNRIVMQFGKRDDDRFSCDFQAPLSATQAFAIALTAFDNKIACE